MKKLLMIIGILGIVFLQAQTYGIDFQRCFGGSGDENVESMIETSDGGLIMAGYSNSNNGDLTGNNGIKR